jgi:hypothetical protein
VAGPRDERHRKRKRWFYQLNFHAPGVDEAELERARRASIRRMLKAVRVR